MTCTHSHCWEQIPISGYMDWFSFAYLNTNTYCWLYWLVLIRIVGHKYLLLAIFTGSQSYCWAQIHTSGYKVRYSFRLFRSNTYHRLYGHVFIRIVENKYLLLALWSCTYSHCLSQIPTAGYMDRYSFVLLSTNICSCYMDWISFALLNTNTFRWLRGLVLIRIVEHKSLPLDIWTCTYSHCWAQIPTADYMDLYSFALLGINTFRLLNGRVVIRIVEQKYLPLAILTGTHSHCWAQIPTSGCMVWYSFRELS